MRKSTQLYFFKLVLLLGPMLGPALSVEFSIAQRHSRLKYDGIPDRARVVQAQRQAWEGNYSMRDHVHVHRNSQCPTKNLVDQI